MPNSILEETIAKKAHTDGAYAIAFALLQVASSQHHTARALEKLGNGDASTHFGAIEGHGMMMDKIATALDGVASAVASIQQQG